MNIRPSYFQSRCEREALCAKVFMPGRSNAGSSSRHVLPRNNESGFHVSTGLELGNSVFKVFEPFKL